MCSHMWKPGQSRNPAGHSGVDRTWRTAPQCRYFITALIDRIDVGANQIDIRLRPRRLSALLDIATSAFTCGLGPRLNWERASTPTMIEEIRFAGDLYGAFSVKRLFWVCCQFFVRSGKAVLRPVACDQVRGARGRGQGTETLAELGGLPPSVACVSQRLEA